MCKKLLCHHRLRRRNEYVHSAEVVPWQMFVATYAGMSIQKKNSSDVHINIGAFLKTQRHNFKGHKNTN